ncbi:MAG TPA: dihydrodipicolinate synthase family protein [Vicinamibacterales bacterium]
MPLVRPLTELVAATYTPFDAAGALAPAVVPQQAAFLAANGIRTVFITGTTGECLSLTHAERLTMLDAWAEAGPAHGLAVIAHVGGNSLGDARELARRSAQLGLAAISAFAPSYFRPASLDALIDWCAAIADAAPDLPFYYYDIPSMTGVSFPTERLLTQAPVRIPNFAGVKFTNPDLVSYRRCLDLAGDRFDLPWGMDEALLGALATGARCAVGSTYNWMPELSLELRAAVERGDLTSAQRLQARSIAIIDAVAACGYLGASKALLSRLGLPLGPVRPPLHNPAPAEVDALMARLGALGFAEWAPTPPAGESSR